MILTKSTAIKVFGSRYALAAAIGNTPEAVSMWKEVLTRLQADRVIAAAWRENLLHYFEQFRAASSATPAGAEVPAVGDGRVGDGDGR